MPASARLSPRAVDLMLAATMALLPLLPTGPQYFGLPPASWVEGAFVPLFALLLVTPRGGDVAAPSRGVLAPAVLTPAVAGAFMAPFLAALAGSAVVGLASDNVFTSSAFPLILRDGVARLFVPMDQIADPVYALRVWLTFVEGPAAFLLVLVLCRRAPSPRERALWALGGATIGLAMVSAFALLQYVTRFRLHPYWVQANPDLVRSHSTLEDPNTLGSYLVLGAGIAFGIALRERMIPASRWRAWLAAGASILAGVALATSVSRAAWGALTLAGLFATAFGTGWAASNRSRVPALVRRAARLGIVALGVVAVAWLAARLWLPAREGYRPTSPLDVVRATVDPTMPIADVLKGRSLYWEAALQLARSHPVVGVGLGRFPRELKTELSFPFAADNAHNLPLQVLAETGPIGLLAALLPLLGAAWALRAAVRAGASEAPLAWGLSLGCLAFLLTLLTGHPLLLPSIQLVVGTSLAAGLCAISTPPSPVRSWFCWSWFSWPRVAAVSVAVAGAYAAVVPLTTCACAREPYGYAWGLYDPDRDPTGRVLRWMGRSAVVYVTPPEGTSELVLEFAAFPPPDNSPTTVAWNIDGQQVVVPCRDGAWRQVRVALDPASARRGVEIRVDVDRTVVPASLGGSGDPRPLGVVLRPPAFHGTR